MLTKFETKSARVKGNGGTGPCWEPLGSRGGRAGSCRPPLGSLSGGVGWDSRAAPGLWAPECAEASLAALSVSRQG